MKKILTIAILALVATVSYGQTNDKKFVKYYLGTNFNGYNKLLAKVTIDNNPSYTFFTDVPEKSYDDKKILYPAQEYKFTTDVSKLKDRIFRIDSIMDMKEKSYLNNEKLFKMVDINNGDIIYYKYRTDFEYDYCLSTEPIKLREDDFKNDIEKEVDEFTKEIKYNSPYSNDAGVLYKYIKNGKTTYYLSLETSSSGIYRGSGVTVLFTDGTKWSRPNEKIDINYRSGFQNSAFILLTASDLQIFKTKTIKKFRLYIHDQDVSVEDADKFKIYSSLITKL